MTNLTIQNCDRYMFDTAQQPDKLLKFPSNLEYIQKIPY